ncbi:hypothetical protein FQA47_006697 [Oryzias melastigma]|uniref:Uncharacterized protein n=1 Tax=Oryzias melastigma TaxID=30732 RepID=A0A834F1J3_ORYME|nr:hypothetical protein FQA47_006697 [Oryzias melastigma]
MFRCGRTPGAAVAEEVPGVSLGSADVITRLTGDSPLLKTWRLTIHRTVHTGALKIPPGLQLLLSSLCSVILPSPLPQARSATPSQPISAQFLLLHHIISVPMHLTQKRSRASWSEETKGGMWLLLWAIRGSVEDEEDGAGEEEGIRRRR